MTLIELLVTILVIGAIATVLTAAITVTFRQQASTEARIDVARWEQSLALWLPNDLASATDVSAEASDTPPGCVSDCATSANALQLSWNDGSGLTTVSYRYGPASGGESFQLTRVVCNASGCTSQVVLRDLAVPSDDLGNPIPWSAPYWVPDTVINVTVPLAVGSTDPDSSGAKRVIINVNGIPGPDGVDRSSTISFTAGGSTRGTLPPTVFSGPEFLHANSGCGGPVTLIVDNSNSLSTTDFGKVRTGVKNFVQAFEGTPTRLQIIRLGTISETLGTSSWNRFFDLSEPSDVELLIGPTGDGGFVSTIDKYAVSSRGGTNWEDALFRTFFLPDGTRYSTIDAIAPAPELVVFFTDGVPTYDRGNHKSDSSSDGPSPIPDRFQGTPNGSSFHPRAWFRADWVADQFRTTRLIGVGVGTAFDLSTTVNRAGWPSNPIPNEVFLGDIAEGGDPSQHGTGDSGGYVKREYGMEADGEWGDVSSANLLVTNDMSKLGSALTAIALVDCGGTLTVQTRDQAGNPADADITYQVGDKVVTTTRIAKAGTFDIPLNGVPSDDVDLIPQSFDATGYTPTSWGCRAGGVDLVEGTDFHLLTPGSPGAGIEVTVRANAAVSCTLRVSP